MTEAREPIRFYFSFRSPYSWLAQLRVEAALAPYPVELQYLPVFPPPNFPNDPAAVPSKLKYIGQDIARIAEAYGIVAKPPSALDCDWMRPHAAFVYAADQGKARDFALGMYAARFVHDRDVGEDAVIADVARSLGLDGDAAVRAAGDKEHQTRVFQGMMKGATEDDIFGVPLFVFRGERFWGNDRIEWLLRSIRRAYGMPVPDLRAELLAAPHR
jgi:2-hydroxychromene-2-carboxylate isomerase